MTLSCCCAAVPSNRPAPGSTPVRLLAILLVIAVAFGAIAGVLGMYSASQTNRAQRQAQLATSRSLAAQAERLADRQSDLAQLLSLQSLHTQLTGHTDSVAGVAFSPDGTLLATASTDGTTRLWAAPSTWVDHSCELVGRNLSQQEWDHYVGAATPYVRQCAQYPLRPRRRSRCTGRGLPLESMIKDLPAL